MFHNKYRHQIPYIILFFIHTAILLWTFYQKKSERKSLVLLLCGNIGIAYLFEYIAFSLLGAYQYRPMFFRNKRVDNTVGAVLSQAIYVPFTALAVSAFKLGWGARVAVSFYFYLIEKFFIALKIYRAKWWKPVFTLVLLPVYFKIDNFFHELINNRNPLMLTIILFFIIDVMYGNVFYILALLRKIRFGRGMYFSWNEHFKIAPIYALFLSLGWTWSQKDGVSWKRAGVILMMSQLTDIVLKRTHIFKAKPAVLIPIHISMYFYTLFTSHFIQKFKIEKEKGDTQLKRSDNKNEETTAISR